MDRIIYQIAGRSDGKVNVWTRTLDTDWCIAYVAEKKREARQWIAEQIGDKVRRNQ